MINGIATVIEEGKQRDHAVWHFFGIK